CIGNYTHYWSQPQRNSNLPGSKIHTAVFSCRSKQRTCSLDELQSDIRPLPHLLASRRLSLEGKQAEAQVIRKSVSFSLRARGPGAGYNSTSPDQQSPPLQRPDSHPEQLNSSGGRNGAGLDKDKQSPLGGGNYRVLLVDSPQHSEKVVVRAICAVVPIADEVHARNCYCTSKQLGMAIITTALKEHAELYR
ncbi:hypothetical protein Vretifemale_2546, partial [Volvox reticuliferus]